MTILGHTIANSVKASFFACYHDIRDGLTLLPTLRRELDPPISIQHMQEPICSVPGSRRMSVKVETEVRHSNSLQSLILCLKLFIDIVVWRAERIYVRLVYRGTWQPNRGSGSVRDYAVPSFTVTQSQIHRIQTARNTTHERTKCPSIDRFYRYPISLNSSDNIQQHGPDY